MSQASSARPPDVYAMDDYVTHRRFLVVFHSMLFRERPHPVSGERRRLPFPPAYVMDKEGHILIDRLVKWVQGYNEGYILDAAHPEFMGYVPVSPDRYLEGVSFDHDIIGFRDCYVFLKQMPFVAAAVQDYIQLIVNDFPHLAFGPKSMYGLQEFQDGRYAVSSSFKKPFDFKKALLHPESLFPAWPFPLHSSHGTGDPRAAGDANAADDADDGGVADDGGDARMSEAQSHGKVQREQPHARVHAAAASAGPSTPKSSMPSAKGNKRKAPASNGTITFSQFFSSMNKWHNEQHKSRRIAFQEQAAKDNKQKRFRPNKEGGSDNQ